MLLALPSLEAPKNIFLILFMLISIWRLKLFRLHPTRWDGIFFLYACSALLSAIFAGYNDKNEWSSLVGMLIWTSFGWIISKTDYTKKEKLNLIIIAMIACLPPMLWGAIQLLYLKTKDTLELHSVGHVNHSAIFIFLVYSLVISYFVIYFNSISKNIRILFFILVILFLDAIFIGGSRAAFLSAVLFTTLLLLLNKNSLKIKLIVSSIFIMLFSLNYISHDKLENGLIQKQINKNNANSQLSGRNAIWNISIEAAKIYPYFGVGNNNWRFIKESDIQKQVESRGEIYDRSNYVFGHHIHSHSLYFSALVERGIVGFSILIMLMSAWLILLKHDYKYMIKSKLNVYVWFGSLAGWLSIFFIGLVASSFHHENAILGLLLLGLHINNSKINMNKTLIS